MNYRDNRRLHWSGRPKGSEAQEQVQAPLLHPASLSVAQDPVASPRGELPVGDDGRVYAMGLRLGVDFLVCCYRQNDWATPTWKAPQSWALLYPRAKFSRAQLTILAEGARVGLRLVEVVSTGLSLAGRGKTLPRLLDSLPDFREYRR